MLLGCTVAQAEKILELRPFDDVADLNDKLQQGKKKAGPAGISSRMFNDCVTIFSGYGSVDAILEDCERIGSDLRNVISSWTAVPGDSKEPAAVDDGSLSLITFAPPTNTGSQDCLTSQPSTLGPGIQLKDYQLSGVSWLRLLHRRKLSCILADEMGQFMWIMVRLAAGTDVFV
jgi:SWI/SNF-related matrix-associated actin-dependent regulator 1 of chromatin subfamily A